MRIKNLVFLLLLILICFGLIHFFDGKLEKKNFDIVKPSVTNLVPEKNSPIQEILTNLEVPWQILFLPNGNILITERPGKLVLFDSNRSTRIDVAGVKSIGEGGLLGAILHPNFSNNEFIYLYYTMQEGTDLTNRIYRYKFDGTSLREETLILQGILGSSNHDGGRIAFGPDGFLYITTGDAQNTALSQDIASLNGKVLRVTDTGSVPEDNPFVNAVYSYGHRNPQGLAWDEEEHLWLTEHGPSGADSGWDELNLIEKGKNYGWPLIKGDMIREDMVAPIINSGSNDTWAPSGAVYYEGKIFFAGLRGEALYEFNIATKNLTPHFKNEFGRIRDVALGPDKALYIVTNNLDGRGSPGPSDDRLIRIELTSL